MSSVLLIAGVVAAVVASDYYLYRAGGRRRWNPLWMAFTLTAVAVLYGTAGLLGYAVPLHNPVIEHRIVGVGHIVWPQVRMASVVALISVYPWTLGLKQLRSLQ
jgi:hypothetical protein